MWLIPDVSGLCFVPYIILVVEGFSDSIPTTKVMAYYLKICHYHPPCYAMPCKLDDKK